MDTILQYIVLVVILTITGIVALIYYTWNVKYNYWKERNVPYVKPEFPFGNTKDILLSRRFIGYVFRDLYFDLKDHKYGGYFNLIRPELIIRDPEKIKQILTKDFNYFTDRGIHFDGKRDPLQQNLFNLKGDKWRMLRLKLSPTFSPGKIKTMFHLVKVCSEKLRKNILVHAENEQFIEVKGSMAGFVMDIIGLCAFGIDIDSTNDPNNELRRISRKLFTLRPMVILRNFLNALIPGISVTLRIKTTPREREKFFTKLVTENIEFREKNDIKRNDFLDLLIQMKKEGILDDKSTHDSENHIDVTNELITAQSYLFFIAGFETSSTTLSFCLYELALNKTIQTKLQNEIDQILKNHKGEITYESLTEMTYMDNVVNETLRKYSPFPIITRECTKDCPLDGTNLVIKKGTQISIPIFGLHYDPEYYPEPEIFDPERFTKEARQSRHQYTWLAFGNGPRNCLGLRFGILQVKIGLATILSDYNLALAPETQVPIEISNSHKLTQPKTGIKIRVLKRLK